MKELEDIKERIRQILIEKEGNVQPHDFKDIIDDAKKLGVDDKQIRKLVPEVDRSINWEYIKLQKEKEREKEQKLKNEIQKLEEEQKFAPEYIDTLIKFCFSDGIIEAPELEAIFSKTLEKGLDINSIARKINSKIEAENFKPYPNPNLNAQTLKDTLCSTNWYNQEHYIKLTTPPPPPPEPFPWKILVTAVLLIGTIGGSATYFFYLKPKWRDEAAPRYYVFAQNVTLRSSPIAGVDHNKLESLNYGAELITYEKGVEWFTVKANGKEGYVSAPYVLDSPDFYLLNSIFGDPESKEAIESSKCRKALLSYFKNKNYIGKMDDALQRQLWGSVQFSKEIWQVFSKSKNVKPNTFIYPRVVNPNSKFTDFGVLIKNVKSGNRKFLLFAFRDDETPYLVDEQPAQSFGDIKDVKKLYKGGQFVYEVKYTGF